MSENLHFALPRKFFHAIHALIPTTTSARAINPYYHEPVLLIPTTKSVSASISNINF